MPGNTPVLSAPITLTPFRIGPDWITLSMSGPPSLLSFTDPTPWVGNRVWVNSGKRTQMMGRLFYLLNADGEKLLTVAGWPNKAMGRAPDWMQVQFANVTLHTGEFVELYDTLRSMGFRYLGVSRLDIAADGIEDAGGDFNAPLQWEMEGAAQYYGRLHWQPRREGRTTVKGAALGAPSSNKWFRVYDKTRELKTAAAKGKAGYIRAAWTAALGFDPMDEGRTVQRFEFRTRGREIRRYFAEESTRDQDKAQQFVASLFDQSYLADVFASMAATCYDFRTPAQRARDARRLVQWDFGAVKSGDLKIAPREPKKMAITDNALKITIKGMWRIAYANADVVWMDKAQEMAAQFALIHWFNGSRPAWEKELRAIMEAAARSGDTARVIQLHKLRPDNFHNADNTPADSAPDTE